MPETSFDPSKMRGAMGLLTAAELAATLEVAPETLATWRSRRTGPKHVQLGRQVYYHAHDVMTWVDEQRTAAQSDEKPAKAPALSQDEIQAALDEQAVPAPTPAEAQAEGASVAA